ncbi:MAG: hypothetical protein H6621_09550 [Halobacteriovoraceae bacterium]|nr:hypothetical protein [Halobacteriovoraceae bacterium]MCB9095301.1 hypothetical protein [Halobacteriovoraceae bacterium]
MQKIGTFLFSLLVVFSSTQSVINYDFLSLDSEKFNCPDECPEQNTEETSHPDHPIEGEEELQFLSSIDPAYSQSLVTQKASEICRLRRVGFVIHYLRDIFIPPEILS